MNIEIGAFEAKTRLPELLRGVAQGKRYTITNRGKPVAELVPIIEKAKLSHEQARLHMIALVEEVRGSPGFIGMTQAEIKEAKQWGRR
jgi:prevent-host-death family protein